ncbi:MAG: helix-turn-helix transcriptional regulator [Chloroflexi bacterium]|nr:helix-turn-helix transcriptional regulator [Chloroflexota bacterium]
MAWYYREYIGRRGKRVPEENLDYPPDLLRGNTENLLLSLIDELPQTYGYQLIKEILSRSRGFLRFKEGTVYPALRKLENEGLIHGEWLTLANGQRRRAYRITPRGREALHKRVAMWKGFTDAINLVLRPARAQEAR